MGDLSPSFDRRELACKCGCAYDDISLDLVDILQSIRDHFGQPVHIVSGCRCARHNKRVAGARRTQHRPTSRWRSSQGTPDNPSPQTSCKIRRPRDSIRYRCRIVAIFDMCRTGQKQTEGIEVQARMAEYIDACRQRIPAFVAANYSGRGAIGLNRRACGRDVLVAPFNFLMGFPNFLLRVLAVVLDFFGLHRTARRMAHWHLGLPTRVQKTLATRLMSDLLQVPDNPEEAGDRVRRVISSAAREPVKIYVQTRNVAADITAGTLAALAGLAFLHRFTPGSISAGTAIAQFVAEERAVSGFPLGETLGGLYYTLFPTSPSPTVIALALLLVMATVAVVAALSGIIHDPIQAAAGVHRRRLHNLLDAIEESIREPAGKGYRPKDTFFGRLYDLIDWVKGVLSF